MSDKNESMHSQANGSAGLERAISVISIRRIEVEFLTRRHFMPGIVLQSILLYTRTLAS